MVEEGKLFVIFVVKLLKSQNAYLTVILPILCILGQNLAEKNVRLQS